MSTRLESVLVSPDATIRQALSVIDTGGLGVALVVNGRRQLLGLVTDGDLRRAMLDGHGLEAEVRLVMNPEPMTASKATPREQVFGLMNVKIRHIPVLDEDRRVCDLVCFVELSRKIPWAIPYIGEEEQNEVADTVRSAWVTMGPKVARLEREMAAYVGVKYAVAVSSGTAALDVALKVLHIGPGDEVIVPALTYIATANAVLYQHATPVLADVDPTTFNLDPEDVRRRITPRTKCIMPIDYGGQSADYDALGRIAREHGLALVEDGAQSLGGEYKGRRLCSFGVMSTVSFHAAKVITSVEGGMVLTDDEKLADLARVLRNQGEDPVNKYHHAVLGHNYRMTDLHAAVGLAQFRRLNEVLRRRAEIADFYTKRLTGLEGKLTLPAVAPERRHAWFFYPVLLHNRDEVVGYLKEKGIDTRIAWPLPIHKQPLYRSFFEGARFPVAERLADSVLNLPLYYEMSEEEAQYVVMHLKDAVTRAGKTAR
ncbi:MAG: aminotransferase class I/II-fold pyridoxal phosphate-dependent enzyme [Nitrospirae bacterium]|nr:MAG: aminotransferase class I/II-fold pyridoxal phosphate-dependent enzyme [Nitrospirota bacterium]